MPFCITVYMIKKIGFACKISRQDAARGIVSIPEYNAKATTVAWLNRQRKPVAEQKLWDLLKHNIESAKNAVKYVANLEESLRCFRLSSDLLPVYTEPTWCSFWQDPSVKKYCEQEFSRIGDIARKNSVRLSFHPGQFCCIVSDSADVVTRSLDELEYHADMVRWMGYGRSKLDFKINVHLSGRRGVSAFNEVWHRMSPELRNCLTLENDEYQKGIDELLALKHKVGIVLDIHHHLIKEGEYIQPTDLRIEQIRESWQGVRPIIHYSQSREEYLSEFSKCMPTFEQMLTVANRSKLRAHSDFYANEHINKWAVSHLEWADLMCESKAKNLASFALKEYAASVNAI